LDEASATEYRNVPAVLASQTLKWVTVSGEVPAQDDHVGVFDIEMDPADAALNVADGRVVTELAALAADAPGSPVWSFTKLPAGAVDACAR
jgi:hypothetical protein